MSKTEDNRRALRLRTEAASQPRTTHGSGEFSNQSVAGRGGHIPDNAATPSLPNSATSHLHSTCRHSQAANRPELSTLGHHVTNQTEDDLVMQRYLNEVDNYKEFLVREQDERGHMNQVVGANLEEWNRRWDEMAQLRNSNQSKFLAGSHPESRC